MLNRKNRIYLPYSILWIYYCQGILYPTGSIISQILIFVFIAIAFIAYFKVFGKRNLPAFINIWTVFCAIQIITYLISPKTVYGTRYEAIGEVSTTSQMKDIFSYCLSFYIGLNIGLKRFISEKTIARIGMVILGIAVVRYMFDEALTMALFKIRKTNNSAYLFVTVIPFLPSMFKVYRKISILSIFVILAFTIGGAKRGAIVCTLASFIYYGYWYLKNHRVKLTTIIGGLALLCAIAGYSAYKYSENELLRERLEKTKDKGIGAREIGYAVMFNHWINDSNPFTKIFGNGSTQTVTVWGNFGHNDWLEILIDNGLFGVLLYASFFISCMSYIKRTNYLSSAEKLTCYLILLSWFLKTIFSMGYSSVWNSFAMILLGLLIGNSIFRKKLKQNQVS